MGNRPFDSAATKVTHQEEAETDTYELTEHAANVPLGTSSSRVTARFGAGIAVGGAGTSGGKTCTCNSAMTRSDAALPPRKATHPSCSPWRLEGPSRESQRKARRTNWVIWTFLVLLKSWTSRVWIPSPVKPLQLALPPKAGVWSWLQCSSMFFLKRFGTRWFLR